jgi:hypothetical protein
MCRKQFVDLDGKKGKGIQLGKVGLFTLRELFNFIFVFIFNFNYRIITLFSIYLFLIIKGLYIDYQTQNCTRNKLKTTSQFCN